MSRMHSIPPVVGQRLHLPHALQPRQSAAMSFRMIVFSFSGAARRGPRDRFRGAFPLEQSPFGDGRVELSVVGGSSE